MPRPRKYESHKLEAYEIYMQRKANGEDVSALDIQVDLQGIHPEGTASYRLIANWVKEFKTRDEWQVLLDVLINFFDDCCVIKPSAQVGSTPLYKAYQKWCQDNGEDTITQTMLGTCLGEKGFQKVTIHGRKFWRGIGLLEKQTLDEATEVEEGEV